MKSKKGNPLKFAMEGERVRRAASVLERESKNLTGALRRAIPFLTRRSMPVTVVHLGAVAVDEVVRDFTLPMHATSFVTSPGKCRGALVLDANAAGTVLDAVLGGDGQSPPTLNPAGMSAAQAALVTRVAAGVLGSFSDVMEAGLGFRLNPVDPSADSALMQGTIVACVFEFGEAPAIRRIAFLLAKEAFLAEGTDDVVPESMDPRVSAILGDVEVEVVAELGRLRMKLNALAGLKVGDTLRLDLRVNEPVHVLVSGQAVLRGRPTTSGGQIAIQVLERHES